MLTVQAIGSHALYWGLECSVIDILFNAAFRFRFLLVGSGQAGPFLARSLLGIKWSSLLKIV